MDIFSLLWMMLGACLGAIVMALFAISDDEDGDE